jgi:hypothetical protein
MTPQQTPFTGKEVRKVLSASVRALVEFYDAFNSRDIVNLSENWAQTGDIAMDNPLGGITRGWAGIKAVYERIFSGPARVYVEFYNK